jgi:hypothetical protein
MPDPASYRDPAGHVHLINGKVYRSILPPGGATSAPLVTADSSTSRHAMAD